jgi:hypothetical protein
MARVHYPHLDKKSKAMAKPKSKASGRNCLVENMQSLVAKQTRAKK